MLSRLIELVTGRSRLSPEDAYAPRVAADTVVYAIGDVHGRIDLLRVLEAQIVRHAERSGAQRRVLVYLGDFIDRGAESRAVIEHLLAGPPLSFERFCLRGNHEAYMELFLEDSSVGPAWLANGGQQTLESYGVMLSEDLDVAGASAIAQKHLRAVLPQAHREFLASLLPSHREGDYLFVHAGIRPGVPLDQQDPEDLMWIRDEFLDDDRDFGAVVVHGHTIRREPDARANRIGIDTGAYATGRLTCLVLQGTEQEFLQT